MRVMKKYMIMCMAVMALLFASCKNEDISISREVSFEVNPYTVIRDFTEDPLDHIANLPSDGKLRVRLLVYDAQGQLVQSSEQQLNGYDEKMNTSLELGNGVYTAIVITDIARKSNQVPEYWTLDSENQLNTLKIFNAGYISLYNILGLAKLQFAVSAEVSNTHLINVEPAGALILSIIYDIHHNDEYGIQYYSLLTNRTSESCSFSSDGECNYHIANSNYEKRVAVLYTEDYSYGGLFYDFELPLGKTSLKWSAEGVIDVTDEMVVDMKAGEEYLFELDFEEGTYHWGVVNGGKNITTNGQLKIAHDRQIVQSSEMLGMRKEIQCVEVLKLLEKK